MNHPLDEAYLESFGASTVPDTLITEMIGGFLRLEHQRDWLTLDVLLADAEPSRLAPAVMVCLLRGTFNVRQHLPHWVALLHMVRMELVNRKHPDVEGLLQGLGWGE